MARTLTEIQNGIYQHIAADATLSTKLTSTSKVAVWRLWVYIVAFAIWSHELIVDKNAENSRPHTIDWYRTQVLNFIDGAGLIWQDGQFQFDLSEISVGGVEERMVVKKCAIEEQANGSLMIKVSGENGPIEEDELVRLQAYMKAIKDAGNKLKWRNAIADDLLANLTVYVDPLIIDLETGALLDVEDDIYPVHDAIYGYLNNLEFNGAFVKTKFIDAIQAAEGVQDVQINSLQWKFGGNSFADFGRYVVPYAGYFAIAENDLTLTFERNDLA